MKIYIFLALMLGLNCHFQAFADSQLDNQLRDYLDRFQIHPLGRPTPANQSILLLGQALFYDKILSGNKNISCATCHHPQFASGDQIPFSIGEGGHGLGPQRYYGRAGLTPRNAPPLFNLAGVPNLFWDGRVSYNYRTDAFQTPEAALNGPSPARPDIVLALGKSALAAQALFPITSHTEMRGQVGSNELANAQNNLQVWDKIMERLLGSGDGQVGGIEAYKQLFRNAFPDVTNLAYFNIGYVGYAIAAFEIYSFSAVNTPLDQYLRGNLNALTENQKQGALVFLDKGRCARCHNGPLLSNFQFETVAIPQVGPGKHQDNDDFGRYGVTGANWDLYSFRVPPLRNVAYTGPWTHDGAFNSLNEVIEHYNNPQQSLQTYRPRSQRREAWMNLQKNALRNSYRLSKLSRHLPEPLHLTSLEKYQLLDFLTNALSDPNSLQWSAALIPSQSPSGLPVRD